MEKKQILVVLNHKTKEIDLYDYVGSETEVRKFVAKKGYDNGTWDYMMVYADKIKVNNKTEGTHTFLASLTINSQLGFVKSIEVETLKQKMQSFGFTKYDFPKDDSPIVLAEVDDEAINFAVTSVSIDDNGNIILSGFDPNNVLYGVYDIYDDNVAEGHLQYVTDNIFITKELLHKTLHNNPQTDYTSVCKAQLSAYLNNIIDTRKFKVLEPKNGVGNVVTTVDTEEEIEIERIYKAGGQIYFVGTNLTNGNETVELTLSEISTDDYTQVFEMFNIN